MRTGLFRLRVDDETAELVIGHRPQGMARSTTHTTASISDAKLLPMGTFHPVSFRADNT